jgi:hypothetical protein
MAIEADPIAPADQKPTESPAKPPMPADLQKLIDNPDAFKERLAREREAGVKAVLKEHGFADAEAMKAFVASAKAKAEAEKTEAEKTSERIKALEPRAARAESLEKTVARYLEAEESAIQEDKRALLELAPADPEARLDWISKAKGKGLFGIAAQAAPKAVEPPKPADPATTMAPPGPQGSKTQAKTAYETYQEIAATGNRVLAANYRIANARHRGVSAEEVTISPDR